MSTLQQQQPPESSLHVRLAQEVLQYGVLEEEDQSKKKSRSYMLLVSRLANESYIRDKTTLLHRAAYDSGFLGFRDYNGLRIPVYNIPHTHNMSIAEGIAHLAGRFKDTAYMYCESPQVQRFDLDITHRLPQLRTIYMRCGRNHTEDAFSDVELGQLLQQRAWVAPRLDLVNLYDIHFEAPQLPLVEVLMEMAPEVKWEFNFQEKYYSSGRDYNGVSYTRIGQLRDDLRALDAFVASTHVRDTNLPVKWKDAGFFSMDDQMSYISEFISTQLTNLDIKDTSFDAEGYLCFKVQKKSTLQ